MSNFPDMVTQFGGQPVGGGRYEAMWGSKVHFIDYDYGTEGAGGLKPSDAHKYLQDAIDIASPWDVFYIRPRDPVYDVGGGANYHLPESTSNWSIPYTAYGLSLIGTGIARGNTAMATYLRGGAVTTAAPVLLIKSCWNNIENLAFHVGASLQSHIRSQRSATATDRAYANTYNSCIFRFGVDFIENNLQGGIHIESSSYESIYNCIFQACPTGIVVRTSVGAVTGIVISGCHFTGLATEVQCDICSPGGTFGNLSIKNCTFGHAVPAKTVYAAALKRYIYIGAASTGLVSNCDTGAVDPTVADNMTLNGVLYSNIWGDGVGPFVDA